MDDEIQWRPLGAVLAARHQRDPLWVNGLAIELLRLEGTPLGEWATVESGGGYAMTVGDFLRHLERWSPEVLHWESFGRESVIEGIMGQLYLKTPTITYRICGAVSLNFTPPICFYLSPMPKDFSPLAFLRAA